MEPSEVACPPLSALFSMRVSFGRSLNDVSIVTTQPLSQGPSSPPPLSLRTTDYQDSGEALVNQMSMMC